MSKKLQLFRIRFDFNSDFNSVSDSNSDPESNSVFMNLDICLLYFVLALV